RAGEEDLRAAAPRDAGRRTAASPPGARPGLPRPEGRGDPRRGESGRAHAGREGRTPGPVLPAPARAHLRSRRRAGEGARPARAVAEDPLLPLARLAQDRSEFRSAPRQPAVPEARRGTVRAGPTEIEPDPRANPWAKVESLGG